MSGYVYLLKQKSQNRFKIGKANHYGRINDLIYTWGDFDSDSEAFEITDTDAILVEKKLHRMFSEYNIIEHIKETKYNNKDGYTEFFNLDCFKDVYTELNKKYCRANLDEMKKKRKIEMKQKYELYEKERKEKHTFYKARYYLKQYCEVSNRNHKLRHENGQGFDIYICDKFSHFWIIEKCNEKYVNKHKIENEMFGNLWDKFLSDGFKEIKITKLSNP